MSKIEKTGPAVRAERFHASAAIVERECALLRGEVKQYGADGCLTDAVIRIHLAAEALVAAQVKAAKAKAVRS